MSPKVSPEVSEEVSPKVAGEEPQAGVSPASSGVGIIEKAGICSIASMVYRVALPISCLLIHRCDSKIRR